MYHFKLFTILNLLVFLTNNCSADSDDDSFVFPGLEHSEERADPRMLADPRMFRLFHQSHHHHKENDETKQNNNEIPLDLLQKLSEITEISELSQYLDNDIDLAGIGIASRFGFSEKAAAITPKQATCIPTPQVVELTHANDSSVLYFPSCTRIERCNGCCGHSLLSCQPTQIETVAFQVLVTQYTGNYKFSQRGKETIFVEKHTKCKCGCKIKKEDCKPYQQYKENDCRCVCTNLDEKKKCEKNNNTKLWDPESCECKCREITECSTGLFYNESKCSCEPIPIKRRFTELYSSKERQFNDREKYNIDTVAPLTKEKQNY